MARGGLGSPFFPIVVLLCTLETLSIPFFLVISARLRLVHPRGGGSDVQVSFGDQEGQQLCVQWRSGGSL